MFRRESRVLLRHYLEQGVPKAEIARRVGSYQAAHMLDLAPASYEQLDGNGRSGRKRA